MRMFGIFFSTTMLIWLVVISVPTGFAVATFTYSKGYSYLLDDPKACVNCHIMDEEYHAWGKSTHRHVASCNDCHTPDNFALKYLSKAVNGWNHGYAFTTGDFKYPIQIKDFNKDITNKACLKCHNSMTDHMFIDKSKPINCLHCHSKVGHDL
ncbi:cytochrome c nitrate reductase, small subunit [Bacteriovorax sp. BSW11_IV]|nr:cytochrome c nitrate reductase, small subunit [Bacteriovorax sp. BSW11_IV]